MHRYTFRLGVCVCVCVREKEREREAVDVIGSPLGGLSLCVSVCRESPGRGDSGGWLVCDNSWLLGAALPAINQLTISIFLHNRLINSTLQGQSVVSQPGSEITKTKKKKKNSVFIMTY